MGWDRTGDLTFSVVRSYQLSYQANKDLAISGPPVCDALKSTHVRMLLITSEDAMAMVVPSEVKGMVRESSSTFAAELVGAPGVCWAKELTWQVE